MKGMRPQLEDGFAHLWRMFAPADYPQPVREYEFAREAMGRKWRFDFAWPAEKIAVEIDGGTTRIRGRHVRPKGFQNDCEKLNAASLLGWVVLRFTAHDLNRSPGPTIETVVGALQHRKEK